VNISFTPEHDWFVFNTNTGETIKGGFKSKSAAVSWVFNEQIKVRREAK
jgi:hypothetical protein